MSDTGQKFWESLHVEQAARTAMSILEAEAYHFLNNGYTVGDLTVVQTEARWRKRVSIKHHLGKVCCLNKMGLDSELREWPLDDKKAFRGRITCHGLEYVECFCEADQLYYLFPFDHINVLEETT